METAGKIHLWQHCHNCKASPIVGVRYECQTCPSGPDIDLCSVCYELYQNNKIQHPIKTNGFDSDEPHHFIAKQGCETKSLSTWLSIPFIKLSAPSYPNGFIVRPEFRFKQDSAFGGYAFAVNLPKGRVLLTALHVLDEVIKKNNIDVSLSARSFTGNELPNVIDEVNLYDVLEDKWMFFELGKCIEMLQLPNARLGEEEPKSHRDISAFLIEESANVSAGKLADKSPAIGEQVWLAAKSEDGKYTREAVVVEKTNDSFIFRYGSNEVLPKYASGAPILNSEGNVVAINVGSGMFAKERFGHANHVENIRKHLVDICG